MPSLAGDARVLPLVGVIATVALSILALEGSGVAGADATPPPDVTGKKYSDAQTAISSAGLTPVVSTAVGDQNAWPDCVVTRTQKRTVQPPPNSGGSAVNQLLVSLNCDAGVASATKPGNSAASPAGRAAAAAATSSS